MSNPNPIEDAKKDNHKQQGGKKKTQDGAGAATGKGELGGADGEGSEPLIGMQSFSVFDLDDGKAEQTITERDNKEKDETDEDRYSGDEYVTVLIFTYVILNSVLASGGLIIGVGPFVDRMVADGYFRNECEPGEDGCGAQYDAINPIFDGGFQIMTWMSFIAGLTLPSIGPRYNATFGLGLLTIGCHILSVAQTEDGVGVWMLGYGLIGGGGNFMYISSFHFVNMFYKRAVPIGALGGVFSVSGLVFMLMNIPGVTIHRFFFAYMWLAIILTILTFVIYPDKPLQNQKRHRLRLPTVKHINCYKACSGLVGKDVLSAALHPRFLWFALLFAWVTMVQVVIAGLVNSLSETKTDDEDKVRIFNEYVYPAVGSSTFLFTPWIGYSIQETGFSIPMFLNLLVTQICVLLCWAPGLASQYVMLIFLNLIQGFAYTMQFAYVQLTYPDALYGPLIAFLIAAQGIIGLIAWPGLSPNPFGATAFTPVLLICLIPTTLLYYIPWQQRKYDNLVTGSKNEGNNKGNSNLHV
mmetsp:Transcript_9281/g.22822  ORF Transcript_9281/g.22822 Transcript_9281/m.22822 type:complete len:524 (-) Transcript_9281:137-1708(-)|eukprot:CAMPEP_0114497154 /NCGR_PEP_ID=MMETSP0109-20121206/6161_1 /TAXON_ID=29199 /ORGANISM="Chlorarachnion reptans, Strain CCCM449" /LENGTH=523 /DNA_ID=CAMNT_0001674493 /DNA_START=369 /DNA_END=1940 /DNA_ORIENTATION=+